MATIHHQFQAPPPFGNAFRQRFTPPGARYRPPGFAGQIQSANGYNMYRAGWVEHRPGYTPSGLAAGKQTRKSSHRKTVDYNATVLKTLQNRMWLKDSADASFILPDTTYINEVTTPSEMRYNPINCVTTKFMRQSTNKIRCPIFCVAWTPEGRRLITGASSGEFTLWNGLTFNFETILQAHDTAVRAMVWSHDDSWMLTGDHGGFVKYWQSNMNNVRMYMAHKEPIRGLSFSPTDAKFVSCSDDGTVRLFDFVTCVEEKVLRGHGADVKCVDWHPQKSIIASGSKDSQQPIKLWDTRTGQSLATIHAHKNTVMSMKWNKNGNWFITASRDHLLKLFDIRNMKSDFQTFKGHQKEATTVAWHPIYEDFFCSGGSDGAVKFWNVGTDKEVGSNDQAHDGFIWSMAWHPMGHILTTGSNDHSTKFWARNKPGDTMKDKYNLNLLPIEGEEQDDMLSAPEATSIPGMGLDREQLEQIKQANTDKDGIPGLDFVTKNASHETFLQEKRGRYSYTKRIDQSFAAAWEGKAPPSRPSVPPSAGGSVSEIRPMGPGTAPGQSRFGGLLGDAPIGGPASGSSAPSRWNGPRPRMPNQAFRPPGNMGPGPGQILNNGPSLGSGGVNNNMGNRNQNQWNNMGAPNMGGPNMGSLNMAGPNISGVNMGGPNSVGSSSGGSNIGISNNGNIKSVQNQGPRWNGPPRGPGPGQTHTGGGPMRGRGGGFRANAPY